MNWCVFQWNLEPNGYNHPLPSKLNPSMASQNEEIHYETKPKFMGVVYC